LFASGEVTTSGVGARLDRKWSRPRILFNVVNVPKKQHVGLDDDPEHCSTGIRAIGLIVSESWLT